MIERSAYLLERREEAIQSGGPFDESLREEMIALMIAVAKEMAAAIFGPERRRRLHDELRDYRRALLEQDERPAARMTNAVMQSLEREDAPEEKPFLLTLCVASLQRALDSLYEGTEDAETQLDR
ncbi:MAG: hypothetical protein JXA37_11220 [Chloroflexia bacterium]|nr:hypothetical protein [Chloroflexia bacterium]